MQYLIGYEEHVVFVKGMKSAEPTAQAIRVQTTHHVHNIHAGIGTHFLRFELPTPDTPLGLPVVSRPVMSYWQNAAVQHLLTVVMACQWRQYPPQMACCLAAGFMLCN